MWQDVLFAVRGLRRRPLFASIAILTLAIGIGASTAVFSVVDPLLFRGLPYARADRLVSWGISAPIAESEFMLGHGYVQWQKLLRPFAEVSSISSSREADLGEQNPVRVRAVPVQANLLRVLGVAVLAGRSFTPEDDLPNAPPVALLSFGLWHSRFGGSLSVLGKTVPLDDQQTRIIGILSKNFVLPTLERADLLVAQRLDANQQLRSQTGAFLRTFARLKPGLSIREAREQLGPLFEHVVADAPASVRKEIHLVVRSVRDREFSDLRLASWMLLAAVLALLLLSCANVANLLLARASARHMELAIRAALGARRRRLLRQGLTESLVLACCGGAAGCMLAWLLFRALGTLPPENILRWREATLDGRVLLFALLICFSAGVLFGLAPALQQPGPEALAETRTANSRRSGLRHVLLASQIAISIVLLTGASLFARSLRKLETQAIGLEPAHIVTASFDLDRHRYNTTQKLIEIFDHFQTQLQTIPGVTEFALSDSTPPAGWTHERPFSNMSIVGQPPLASEGGVVRFRYVTPNYFHLLRIPILLGRALNERDQTSAQNSIVLNAKLAARLFGQRNPLGQSIVLSPDVPPVMVVGVAANVKNNGVANAVLPEYELARKFAGVPGVDIGAHGLALFRTPLPAKLLQSAIRARLATVAPAMPVTIETMDERIGEENKRPKFLTVLIGLFAAFGVTLAAVGLYGVAAFLVSQRTREIGIRMAIGATPRNVAALVLKHAALWTGIGVGAGLVLSLGLARLARGLLFEISPHDPVSFFAAIVILTITALGASWWPARRAAKIDPNSALRHE